MTAVAHSAIKPKSGINNMYRKQMRASPIPEWTLQITFFNYDILDIAFFIYISNLEVFSQLRYIFESMEAE